MASLEDDLQNAITDMDDAEDSLVREGFPEDQWMLIKKYILAAIVHNTLSGLKGLENLPQLKPE